MGGSCSLKPPLVEAFQLLMTNLASGSMASSTSGSSFVAADSIQKTLVQTTSWTWCQTLEDPCNFSFVTEDGIDYGGAEAAKIRPLEERQNKGLFEELHNNLN